MTLNVFVALAAISQTMNPISAIAKAKSIAQSVSQTIAQDAQANVSPAPAEELATWEVLDKRIKPQIFQLNVGAKLMLSGGRFAYLADVSPKYHYPLFSVANEDRGFRVVGFGTAFPIKTNRSDKTYFLTNRHVVQSADQITKECERFFAALYLNAEQTAGSGNADDRVKELIGIINLSEKKNLGSAELAVYQTTADAIWDTYDTYLSQKADPNREVFRKYLAKTGLSQELGYYLHAPGPISQTALTASLYKSGKTESDPDLAVITVDNQSTALPIAPLEFDSVEPTEGQEIQVIGYPTASDQIDVDSSQYYAPTFNTGRISRVTPHRIQVDAPITTGNSGGPVVSRRGKVVGVVAVRALSARGGELPNFGGAISFDVVKNFAPELFAGESSK